MLQADFRPIMTKRTFGRTKQLLVLILAVMVMGSLLSGCGIREALYTPGSYEGVSEGYHGPIRVVVTTSAYEIESIEIVEEHEKIVLGDVVDIVYETIPERVRRQNSTKVDVVSGATQTSNALIEAIRSGLDKAMAELEEKTD